MPAHSLDPSSSSSTPQIPFTIGFTGVFPFSQTLVSHFPFIGMIISFAHLGSLHGLFLLPVLGTW